MNIVVITQARSGSTRLPSKILKKIEGKTLLQIHIDRIKQARLIDDIYIATTVDNSDNIIEELANKLQVKSYRGSEDDVLDRYYQTVKNVKPDFIVRLTSDCPLIDPKLIDEVVGEAKIRNLDYYSNGFIENYPDGQGVEVFKFSALEKAWKNAKLKSEREHVTPYIRKNSTFLGKTLFTSNNHNLDKNYGHVRMTVDEQQDFEVIKLLVENLGLDKDWRTYAEYYLNNEHIHSLNNDIIRNEGYLKSINTDKKMNTGQKLYEKAKTLIPGGTMLLSKRPEMFLPDLWPSYYDKAEGCEVWDLDGNKYIDMSYMGVGSCTLGYADPDVNEAVEAVVKKGNMSTLNAPEEVELAELLLDLHPWAEMVRYARGGGDAMAIAVRIARSVTNKDIVLFSGYHGWHDWYLSANIANEKALDGKLLSGLEPNGVPRSLKGTAFPFYYNNKQQFLDLMEKYGDNIGAVVTETVRNIQPEPGFFDVLVKETKKRNIPLIFDEVSSGFRTNTGGAHLLMDIEPDMAVFAKGMSNGYPMAAVIGKKWVMDAAQDSFISSTYWTERIGPAATIASIKKMLNVKAQDHMMKVGKMVIDGWKELSDKHDLNLSTNSFYPLGNFSFPAHKLELKTLYTQEMLKNGFLATTAFYACYAHKEEHVEAYLKATDEVFELIAKAIKEGNIESYLDGPVCQSGFQRLT